MIYVSFFIGLLLICKGGDWFVDAASFIARAFGIPKYIVGATIVSFATTMPEILVSVAAALKGSSVMAIGNAVGSVSANTGIILGISLFCLPVAIRRKEYLTKNILYIGCLILLFLAFQDRVFDAGDCIFLLMGGILFLVMNVKNAMTGRPEPGGQKRIRSAYFFLSVWRRLRGHRIGTADRLRLRSGETVRYFRGTHFCYHPRHGNISAGVCHNYHCCHKKRIFFVCGKYCGSQRH